MSQVSCRVFGVAFDSLVSRGIPVEQLIEGLPYTEQQLREPRRRVEWSVLVEVVGRLSELVGGDEQLEQIGYAHLSTHAYANVRRLASFFASPRDLYWLGTSWFGPNLFGITNDHVETMPDGRILEVIEIPEPYADCPALFQLIAGALRATPSLIGMPDSMVEVDIGPRRGSFLISPPARRLSLLEAVKRLVLRQSPRQFVAELGVQQDELRRTNHELERTVRELRQSEARLTAILDLDSDVRYALRIHPDGRREQLWLTGELVSLEQRPASYDVEHWGGRIHPEDRGLFDARFEEAHGGKIHRLRYRLVTEGGDQHWIQESIRLGPGSSEGQALADAEERDVYHGTLKDVTAQAQAEADLRRLISAVDQANDGIAVADRSMEIVYANSAFHKILRRKPGDLVGSKIGSGLDDRYANAITSLIRQAYKTGTGHERIETNTAEGAPSILDAMVAAVYGHDDTPEGYVGVVRDVTREVELEGQIRFAAHMDVMGQLAGGLAHDFNNLLTVIRGESDVLLHRKSTEPAAVDSLSRIDEAAEQGGNLVQQLFTLTHIERDEPQLLDANEVAESFVYFVRGALAPEIDIELELGEDLRPIRIGRGQLLQILVNLAFNARDAMPEGGIVTVASGLVEVDAELAAALDLSPGPHVWISVRDTGVGMGPEIRERIFEPLYTTKELGRGSGLGLTTALRSMRDLKGAIDVQSEPGAGALFTLYFPDTGGGGGAESDRPSGPAGRL